jgi:hypothetical protein
MKRSNVAAMALAAVLALPLSLPAAAADLTGKYVVEGREPGGQSYAGEAAVMRKGDTYQVIWALGGSQAIGTGILDGNVFAVTYVIRGVPVPGIAIYQVNADGGLAGRFTMLGAEIVGDESWTKAGADTGERPRAPSDSAEPKRPI